MDARHPGITLCLREDEEGDMENLTRRALSEMVDPFHLGLEH